MKKQSISYDVLHSADVSVLIGTGNHNYVNEIEKSVFVIIKFIQLS